MALGTLLGAAVGGLASAGAGFGLSKLFGGKSASNPYQSISPSTVGGGFTPVNINAGGLTSSGGTITSSPERMALVANLADVLNREAAARAAAGGTVSPEIEAMRARLRAGTEAQRGRLSAETEALLRRSGSETDALINRNAAEAAELRARIAPGVSELRRSRLAEIEDARNRAIGNLRENMAQRRVLGSSFGQDALARADREFGGERERIAAESTLQELEATRALDREAFGTEAALRARQFGIDSDLTSRRFATDAALADAGMKGDVGLFLQKLEATNNLLTQEFNARRSAFQSGLDELNLEAEIATKLAAGATSQLGANSRLEAELRAKEAAGQGKFFGQIAEPIGKAFGGEVSNFFKNGISIPGFSWGYSGSTA